jgi:6-phosphogluconolactonase
MKYNLLFISLLGFFACSKKPSVDLRPIVFVGTYTQKLSFVEGKAAGIYTCRLDTLSGALSIVDSLTGIDNPSFLAISPDRRFLYSVSETGGGPDRAVGEVVACKIGPNGHLEKINTVSSYGAAPCHVSIDRSGRFVFVANYVGGNVASYNVRADGGLSDSLSTILHQGDAQPHAHMTAEAPDGKIAAVDLGLDRVFRYKVDEKGRLIPLDHFETAKGAGPRHLDFHPKNSDRFAVINELNSTMLSCKRDATTGAVSVLDSISTLPTGFAEKNSCADVHFHPNGKFLYGSNRGHNSIVAYRTNDTGKLELIGHTSTQGKTPRNFMITPDGKWLLAANQNSGTVSTYRIDDQTGMLTPAGPPSRVPTPVCLKTI